MNYADIKYPDIEDGNGTRIAIYVSGCHFHCKNCHNEIAWDPNYGKPFTDDTIEYIINKFSEYAEYNSGLSLLGGEPLEPYNQEGLLKLTDRFKAEFPDKDIWCWTGYDFDKNILNDMYLKNEVTQKLLANIDIMIDGTYQEDKKIVNLIARGSYNQRKIDVKESLKLGKTVYLEFGDENKYENKTVKSPKKILVTPPESSNVIPMPIFNEISIENIDQAVESIIINPVEEKVAASSIIDEKIDKKTK